MKFFKRFLILFTSLFLLYILIGIVHGTITNFVPDKVINIEVDNYDLPEIISDSIISITTWNLGYGGLGADCHVFYPTQGIFRSKGKMIRPEKHVVEKNMQGGINTLQSNPTDFFLLQEMDIASKRGHFLPMYSQYQKAFSKWGASFTPNFKVQRVPAPLLEPWHAYGAAHSGLATFFKYQPSKNTRYQLPAKHPWPNSIFHLDRCLSVHRFPTSWKKELILINLHNSAFDKDGTMKAKEMDFLKALVNKEYDDGNYVIVGGDWNQSPPFFQANLFSKGKRRKGPGQNIAADLFPQDWSWIFDPLTPTVRSTVDNYDPKETPQGLIDFFLISPNCQAIKVNTLDLQFEHSDHQPVQMEVRLL